MQLEEQRQSISPMLWVALGQYLRNSLAKDIILMVERIP